MSAPKKTPRAADAAATTQATEAPARPSAALWSVMAAVVALVGAVGYSLTGSPGAIGIGPAPLMTAAPANGEGQPGSGGVTDAQVAEMLDLMVKRLKETPNDARGWSLLARAYSSLGRVPEALPAFEKAIALNDKDADLLADYADNVAAADNGQFGGQALSLIQRALAIDPNNIKALALSGSAAFDQRDFAKAVAQWEKVDKALPADSPLKPQVRASINQARSNAGMPALADSPSALGAAQAPASAPAPAEPQASPEALAATAVSGSVRLSAALAAQAKPDDTVFVLARPATGPRMPLAVLRKQVKDLPFDFTLDDSMGMAPTAKISGAPEVIVVARISKSGNAISQPGDLLGESSPIKPGTKGLQIEIDQVVGP